MKLNRNEARNKIITILYQIYMYKENNVNYDVDDVIKENVEIENEFINETVNEILKKKEKIFNLADKYLNNWNMNRLSKIDQAIISLAIYELKYTQTPDIICINEAIELSKKYSDDNVTKMINAVLDKIYKNEI